MKRAWLKFGFLWLFLLSLQWNCPAPLIYRAGEGWSYEPYGGGKWIRQRAKDQLEVAQAAFDKKDFSLAKKAARRTLRTWPFSDYAPEAQYLLGQCYEQTGHDEKAFREYQRLLEKYPKSVNYQEILSRQYGIANKYLAGQWFKLWGYIPFFPSMDKTADMYQKVIRNGPYTDVAAKSQMNIGAAREKQKEFGLAVRAYEQAADRYHDRTDVASEALFKMGLAHLKASRRSEYDRSVATQAISAFNDFLVLYPNDPRVPEAKKHIAALKTTQARGSYDIARFYEKKKHYQGALVYYNEVLLHDPNSSYAEEARQRIDQLKNRAAKQTAQLSAN